ncbi:hypothetical protein BBJ28_00011520 [Nothophytophthora sp. Chile5]|nr:hypothetical protein BBJ28_00011520 [Nothophytophthora sp. Chile5]
MAAISSEELHDAWQKNRSFKSIVNTAKEILKEALPIQCLEAVFLAAYLTAGLPHLERFPISFKTKAGSSTHRHIILAVHYQQHKWGALGLSRCDKLMNKDVKFDSLSDLVLEYCREFQNVYHKVVKVNVGFPLSHDIHSSEKVEWRVLNLPVDTTNWTEVAKHFDMFAKEAAEIEIFKKAKGELPTWFSSKFALNAPDAELGMRLPRRCSNPLDFPDDFDDLDEAPPPEPTPAESPKEVERPIVVSPDELVFKKPSSVSSSMDPSLLLCCVAGDAELTWLLSLCHFCPQSEIPAPPTNVFLQNTTSSPFSIEIEDASGLLEVVTKPQSGLSSLTLQTEDRDEISSETLAKPVSTFRVSAVHSHSTCL